MQKIAEVQSWYCLTHVGPLAVSGGYFRYPPAVARIMHNPGRNLNCGLLTVDSVYIYICMFMPVCIMVYEHLSCP
jgi:hypothetical protein